MCELTTKQQQYVDTITDEENTTKYRTISPGICSSCTDCQSNYGYEDEEQFAEDISNGTCRDEGGFSYHDCELCRSTLGGDRYAAHGYNKDEEIIHYDICTDCLFYLANGEVPEDENL